MTKASTLLSKRSLWFAEACHAARDNDGLEEMNVEFRVALPVVGLQEGSRPEAVGQEQDEDEHEQNTSRQHQQLHLRTRLKKNTHVNSDSDRCGRVGLGRKQHQWGRVGLTVLSLLSTFVGSSLALVPSPAVVLLLLWS